MRAEISLVKILRMMILLIFNIPNVFILKHDFLALVCSECEFFDNFEFFRYRVRSGKLIIQIIQSQKVMLSFWSEVYL